MGSLTISRLISTVITFCANKTKIKSCIYNTLFLGDNLVITVCCGPNLSEPTCYRPQRSWAKLIFSQACVILSTRGCLIFSGGGLGDVWFFRGGLIFSGGVLFFRGGVWFFGGLIFSGGVWFFGGLVSQPARDTVNERPVHILLECILVLTNRELVRL